jgi:acetyl-CoA C-acetyltransferase
MIEPFFKDAKMQSVSVLGVGQTPVGKHAGISVGSLALRACRTAMADAEIDAVDAIFVGNMLSAEVTGQSHLGPLIGAQLGQRSIESVTINAACGSGGAVVRQAALAVASGAHNVVLAVGVEKMSGIARDTLTRALASAADCEVEVAQGANFVALNALLMQRYLYEYNTMRLDFAVFAEVAHRNAIRNPNARLRNGCSREDYLSCHMVADPLGLYDASPVGDGAAAVVLSSREFAERRNQVVDIVGSASASDTLSLQERADPLWLQAAEDSAHAALDQAGMQHADVDLIELHDAFTITAALSLESSGFTPRGTATAFARDQGIHRNGRLPISTFGGLKARGHPVGASGTYQIVEATLQLRGDAGPNQVPSPTVAMTQSIGGSGATVVTHVLRRSA